MILGSAWVSKREPQDTTSQQPRCGPGDPIIQSIRYLGSSPGRARRRRGSLRTRYNALLVRRGSLQADCLGAARDEAPRTQGLGRGIVDPSCPRARGVL